MVTDHAKEDSEGQMELTDDDEEDLCRVWDMAMDKVVFFLCVFYLISSFGIVFAHTDSFIAGPSMFVPLLYKLTFYVPCAGCGWLSAGI